MLAGLGDRCVRAAVQLGSPEGLSGKHLLPPQTHLQIWSILVLPHGGALCACSVFGAPNHPKGDKDVKPGPSAAAPSIEATHGPAAASMAEGGPGGCSGASAASVFFGSVSLEEHRWVPLFV